MVNLIQIGPSILICPIIQSNYLLTKFLTKFENLKSSVSLSKIEYPVGNEIKVVLPVGMLSNSAAAIKDSQLVKMSTYNGKISDI